MIIGPDTTVIERADINADQPIPLPDAPGLANVNETDPQIGMLLDTNSVAAVIKLHGYDNAYLSIVRPLDPRVVAQLRETQATVSDFANLQAAPLRRAARLRADVHGDRAGRAAVGGVARAELRQPAGRADPPPDRRRQHRLDRQSLRPGAGAALGGRSRAARRDLQPHDLRAAHPARRHRARARPDRSAAPLHRSGAGRRQRRRDRRRRRRPHQHPQPLGRKADRPARGRRDRPAAGRSRARAEGALRQRAARHPAAGAGAGDDQPPGPRAQSVGARHHRAVARRASTAMSSRSTTSPSW